MYSSSSLVLEMVAEAPDGANRGDAHGMRLVLLQAAHRSLQERGDGRVGQVGGELGRHP